MIEAINKMFRLQRRLVQRLGREPTERELAAECGMPVKELRSVRRMAQHPISLQTRIGDDGNVIYADGLMDDPYKLYSPDLRKLTDEQKLDRAASRAGVTVEELQTLSDADCKMLKRAYSREVCKSRGIARAAWERLPLAEKLRVVRLEEQTHEPVSVLKEAAEPENDAPEVADSDLARPSDLAWYFNAGSLADAKGTIPGWAATDRPDIVRLWVPKTVCRLEASPLKDVQILRRLFSRHRPTEPTS